MKNNQSFYLALLLTLLLILCPLCSYSVYYIDVVEASMSLLTIALLVAFIKKLLKLKSEWNFFNIKLKRFPGNDLFD
ncbi:MAG: hypothetical protein PF488_01145 [Patescibacteria group bacterium]|jgi:hypothetical protein|nr:hypothetical protein [Patescibacteria group bacterium]